MRSWIVPIVILPLFAACSAGENGAGDDDDDGSLEPVTIAMEPWTVEPGEDRIWCRTMKLPSDVTLDVSRIRITMPEGSHHFILYRTNQDLPDAFGDCNEMNRTFVTGSQTAGTYEIDYPEGKAVPLFAGEQLILESHYANAATAPITASVQVELFPIAHQDVDAYLETSLLVHSDFSIPPETNDFSSTDELDLLPGYNVWQMSSHTHQRMTNFTAEHLLPEQDPVLIYENDDWHSPIQKEFMPPLYTEPGAKFRWTCTWNNETSEPITFGPTTDDEMCILVITYWPAISYSL